MAGKAILIMKDAFAWTRGQRIRARAACASRKSGLLRPAVVAVFKTDDQLRRQHISGVEAFKVCSSRSTCESQHIQAIRT
jgi:hypothetical protein